MKIMLIFNLKLIYKNIINYFFIYKLLIMII